MCGCGEPSLPLPPSPSLGGQDELLEAMQAHKQASSVDLFFLAVVNIVALHSNMLVLGADELSLCQAAFPAPAGEQQQQARDGLYHMGGRVSRKKDYVPFLTKTINKGGWAMPSSKA